MFSVRFVVTIEQIEHELFQNGDSAKIYVSQSTPWWTHRLSQISMSAPAGFSHSFPCDPLGGLLVAHSDWRAFIAAARHNPQTYGKHVFRAFLASHHMNSFDNDTYRPSCERTWDAYNAAIDRYDVRRTPLIRPLRKIDNATNHRIRTSR